MHDEQSAPAATEPPKKLTTKAGFVVDDDDEEEQDAGLSQQQPQPDSAEAAQNGGQTQDVSLASEPTHDSAASDSLNGSTAATNLPIPLVSDNAAATTSPASLPAQDEGKHKNISQTSAAGNVSVSATPAPAANGVQAPPKNAVQAAASTQRLPHDKVGRLEDRIKDDPKADTAAWFELIQHYREKDQTDNVRKVYERMLEVFPTSAPIWNAYLKLEIDLNNRGHIDTLFARSLPTLPDVELWTAYLNYIRRIFPLIPDPDGQSRTVVLQSFEAVLDAVGIDPGSGSLWKEYIEFLKSGPGSVGGTTWQDQQKGDLLREGYKRATKVPMGELTRLWKEYDGFEHSVNRAGGRKALQEQSPHYMQARGAWTKLMELSSAIDRKTLPFLPPLEGCEGDDAFAAQVMAWRSWIEWEISDPLLLKEEGDLTLYRKRVLYAYKQATLYLRFYPTIWFDAAQWCFDQALITPVAADAEALVQQGEAFLDDGISANPESVLLGLKKADRVEASLEPATDDATLISHGERLEVVFEGCHKSLYGLREKMVEREKREKAEIEAYFASLPPEGEEGEADEQVQAVADDSDNEDGKDEPAKPKTREELKAARLKAVGDLSKFRIESVKRLISHVWIAKMRTFRRVQGQGAPKKPKKGFRGVFDESRPRGQLTSDVYIASAKMEWHCYKDVAAGKIFERGLKLFPTDESFALEYIQHMVNNNDTTNARVVFETTVSKILAIKDTIMSEAQRKAKVRPLLGFMHNYESEYGDLAQMQKLEKRMREMFPDEPEIERFSNRFTTRSFDAMAEQIVLSPTQARPKTTFLAPPMTAVSAGMSNLEKPSLQLGPNGPFVAGPGGVTSPKRGFEEISDAESPNRRASKFARAESPLKGAAGRRIGIGAGGPPPSSNIPAGQAGQTTSTANVPGGTLTTVVGQGMGGGGFMIKNYVPAGAPPPPGGQSGLPVGMPPMPVPIGPLRLPTEINMLLQMLPDTRYYKEVKFDSVQMTQLLRNTSIEAVRPMVMAAGSGVNAETFSRRR
ncbi:Suf-domain-containing protein [Teratosphaeria nubilosa]|uniref:mRNA 3'-end-processing protein RNA14 n=1 Tax=Teratosphaeria nubilosa TaxID=161662 RepID=A0A6G1L8D6_9PEZI|nr:Suf-domain-containing protein [Teratosphaeria nubilosa]